MLERLTVITHADLAVQLHILAAMVVMILVPFVMWRKQRDRLHKTLGYTWVTAMAITALSSFAITNFGIIGPFSPLHALSVLTLWVLFDTIRAAIRRDIVRHKIGMRNLATFGLGLPMVLNFLPDRTFTRFFFEGDSAQGLWIFGSLAAVILLWRLWVREDKPLRFINTVFGISQ